MLVSEQTEISQPPAKQYLDKCLDRLGSLKINSAKEGVDPGDLIALTRDYRNNYLSMIDELLDDGRFGDAYCKRLTHDVRPEIFNFIQAFIRQKDSSNPDNLTLIDGLSHIIGSVSAEFESKTEEVSVKTLMEDVLKFLNAYWLANQRRNIPPVKILSFINQHSLKLDSDFKINTNYDVAFRVLLNLISNGAKAARIKMKQDQDEGKEGDGRVNVQASEDKDGKIQILIEDNGPGFTEYLKVMGVDPSDFKELIPLKDILKSDQSVSLFATSSNESGSGGGLRIVEHLARLGKMEVGIKNPDPLLGGQVTVTFPKS